MAISPKNSENPLSTYQKVCENNTPPLNYNYLNSKIIYRRPGIADDNTIQLAVARLVAAATSPSQVILFG